MTIKSFLYAAALALSTLAPTALRAQQEPLYSQHQFNPLTYNPAYAGSNEALSLKMQVRRQWWGFKGAPQGGMLSADWAGKDGRTGWGLGFNAQRIGLYDRADIHGNYAYRMEMGEGKLALGIRAGGVFYQNRLSDAVLSDPDDEVYGQNTSFFVPKVGVGVYYEQENWNFSFALPTLVSWHPDRAFTMQEDSVFLRRHWYAGTAFALPIDEGLVLKPALLLKYVKGAPLQADISAQLYFKDLLGLGAGYRTGDAFSILLDFFPTENLRFGYSYDMSVGKLRNFQSGSHEISVGYCLQSDSGYETVRRNRRETMRYF
ncbi:MAG: type IX secretion system membrane protein PorP/SprF [Chitinophagales bacterium]|nr:type IX secretion system membrane protein PorP/SprF [Chitinophagales bacterium]